MAFITPKTNWSSNDYYNATDLNRVENNIEEIANMINKYFRSISINAIKNRDYTTIEFADSLNRVENNIELLKDNFYTPVPWDIPKTDWKGNNKFDFNDANRLEINLLALFNLVENNINNFRYCGSYVCGEGGI